MDVGEHHHLLDSAGAVVVRDVAEDDSALRRRQLDDRLHAHVSVWRQRVSGWPLDHLEVAARVELHGDVLQYRRRLVLNEEVEHDVVALHEQVRLCVHGVAEARQLVHAVQRRRDVVHLRVLPGGGRHRARRLQHVRVLVVQRRHAVVLVRRRRVELVLELPDGDEVVRLSPHYRLLLVLARRDVALLALVLQHVGEYLPAVRGEHFHRLAVAAACLAAVQQHANAQSDALLAVRVDGLDGGGHAADAQQRSEQQ